MLKNIEEVDNKMTQDEYNKIILNIKDKNIYFYKKCLETKKINGNEVRVFHAYLTYIPDFCPICGCINNGTNNIIKQIKHNACGYRLFKHLRARILLVKGVYKILDNKRELFFSPL